MTTLRNAFRRIGPIAGLVLLLLSTARTQDVAPFQMPADLMPFWQQYYEWRQQDDEEEMDKVVRQHKDEAEDCLNILLDDLSKRDEETLHDEVRTLAWSLDRVTTGERFISRVRLVLELEMRSRRARSEALAQSRLGLELETAAREERTDARWQEAADHYLRSLALLREVGDHEYAVQTLSWLENIEYQRGRAWQRAVYLDQLVAEAALMPYHEPLADEARTLLERLLAQGIDPKQGPPADGAAGGAAGTGSGGEGVAGGRSLTDYAADSADQTFELDPEVDKKGLGAVFLPSFYPSEQHQLWPDTWVGDTPEAIDHQRSWFRPRGVTWMLSRDGMSKFLLDADGDGKPDLDFTASTAPSLIEVPLPGDAGTLPLLVAVLSDREKMFEVEVNYAPSADGSRLRFGSAGWLEGKVLGETWKLYDGNLDGNFGPAQRGVDDLVTIYSPEDSVEFWEVDAVLIGRAKKAVPLSTVLPVGDTFYRTTMDPGQRKLTLRQLDLQTGLLAVDLDLAVEPTHVVVREVGKLEGAFFDILPAKRGGTVVLPVGEYELVMGVIQKGKKTSMDQVRMYKGRSPKFRVEPEKTTTLALGAPFTCTFRTKSDGDMAVLETLSLRVFGRGGEEYAVFFDDPLQPEVEVQVGNHKKKPEKLRRAGVEEWQAKNAVSPSVLWFPVELRVEQPKGAEVKFRLSQKTHSLLGGPITSEWIP